jgi:hypothetical protein
VSLPSPLFGQRPAITVCLRPSKTEQGLRFLKLLSIASSASFAPSLVPHLHPLAIPQRCLSPSPLRHQLMVPVPVREHSRLPLTQPPLCPLSSFHLLPPSPTPPTSSHVTPLTSPQNIFFTVLSTTDVRADFDVVFNLHTTPPPLRLSVPARHVITHRHSRHARHTTPYDPNHLIR